MYTKDQPAPPILFFLFVFILFFSPLAFATVELWSLAIVEISVALLALLAVFHQARSSLPSVAIPGLLPLALLLAWMALQLVPLPPWLLEIVSPGAVDVYLPVYQVAGEPAAWLPLSVNRKETVLELLRIGSYALLYGVSVQVLANGRTLQKIVKLVVGLAVFLAFLAILQRFTSPELIYWFRPGPETAMIMGPWIHRGQFAGFMTMLLPVLLGLFLYYRPVSKEGDSWRTRVAEFFSSSGGNYQLLIGFGIVIILFSILLSLSRTGIFTALCTLLLFYYFLSRKKNVRSWPALAIFVLGIFLFLVNFGAEELLARLEQTFTPEGELRFDRIPTWKDTLEIIKVFWLTGAGFGTFIDVFPMFKTIPGQGVFDHAHNDYLELLTDGGIIGFLLAGWFVVAVLRHAWGKIKVRRDRFAILIGIGALAGICSMLLFSLSDFNMHNGADGLYFFFLCGLLVSCANTRFKYYRSTTLLQDRPRLKWGLLLGALVLGSSTLYFPFRIFYAERMYDGIQGTYLSRQLAPEKLVELEARGIEIAELDPLEGTYRMFLGELKKYQGQREAALRYYVEAAQKAPLRGEFLQKIAFALPEEQFALANELMELSYSRSLKKRTMILNYAEWLLWRGDRERAAGVLKEGAAGDPSLLDEAMVLLFHHFSVEEMAEMLPARVQPWINFGVFAEKRQDFGKSEYFRRRALEFVGNEEEANPSWYSQLSGFYRKQGEEEKAVDVLRQAVEKFPGNLEFHIQLGDHYKKRGIIYRAREEYEQALIFFPDNESLLRRLKELE